MERIGWNVNKEVTIGIASDKKTYDVVLECQFPQLMQYMAELEDECKCKMHYGRPNYSTNDHFGHAPTKYYIVEKK